MSFLVHQSSIRCKEFLSLTVGEVVELDVKSGIDGHTKATNVAGQMVLLLKEDPVIAEVVEVIPLVLVVLYIFWCGKYCRGEGVRVKTGGMEVTCYMVVVVGSMLTSRWYNYCGRGGSECYKCG